MGACPPGGKGTRGSRMIRLSAAHPFWGGPWPLQLRPASAIQAVQGTSLATTMGGAAELGDVSKRVARKILATFKGETCWGGISVPDELTGPWWRCASLLCPGTSNAPKERPARDPMGRRFRHTPHHCWEARRSRRQSPADWCPAHTPPEPGRRDREGACQGV